MTVGPKFKEPITIHNVSFSNRLLRSSIGGRTCNYDGTVTDVWKNFEKRFADGGVGGIVSTTFHVEKERLSPPQYPSIATRRHMLHLKQRLPEIQQGGRCRYIVQIGDPGYVTYSSLFSEDDDGLSSSDGRDFAFGYNNRRRAMSTKQIEQSIAQHAAAALRVREAGADGIEIVAGKGYLIHQFLNPAINRRQDDWGGSEDARFRLLDEILKAVRAAVGEGLSRRRAPVGGRLQCQPATARGRALALTAGVRGFAARQRCRPDGALCEADAGGRLPACGGRVWLPQSARRGRSVSVQRSPQLFRFGAPPERQGRVARCIRAFSAARTGAPLVDEPRLGSFVQEPEPGQRNQEAAAEHDGDHQRLLRDPGIDRPRARALRHGFNGARLDCQSEADQCLSQQRQGCARKGALHALQSLRRPHDHQPARLATTSRALVARIRACLARS